MVWNRNQRIQELVEKSYANFSKRELIYTKHTKVAHSDEHIAAVILLEQMRAKEEAAREAREVERHAQLGVWIAQLKRLHWTAWIMFLCGILGVLIALFAWRAPVAPVVPSVPNANKSPSDAVSQPVPEKPLLPSATKASPAPVSVPSPPKPSAAENQPAPLKKEEPKPPQK